MVTAGLVVGLATGGFPPDATKPVQQSMLILVMAFSLTEISFRGLSPRAELRSVGLAFVMSYAVLGGLVLLYAVLSPDPGIRSGWVIMAAVPPAVAVVPVTSFLKGDVRRSLISEAVLYLLGLITVPGLSLLFLGETVPVTDLVLQTVLLIGVPIVLSRPLRRWKAIDEARPTAVSMGFFVLAFAIAGSTRDTLLGRPDLVGGLAGLSFLRTFGLGLVILAVARVLAISREERIAAVTFAGFKNLGLTVVLAFTFFGPLASLPSLVCLIFEILWLGTLPLLFRMPARGLAESPE